jgi:hypothetical protein
VFKSPFDADARNAMSPDWNAVTLLEAVAPKAVTSPFNAHEEVAISYVPVEERNL